MASTDALQSVLDKLKGSEFDKRNYELILDYLMGDCEAGPTTIAAAFGKELEPKHVKVDEFLKQLRLQQVHGFYRVLALRATFSNQEDLTQWKPLLQLCIETAKTSGNADDTTVLTGLWNGA